MALFDNYEHTRKILVVDFEFWGGTSEYANVILQGNVPNLFDHKEAVTFNVDHGMTKAEMRAAYLDLRGPIPAELETRQNDTARRVYGTDDDGPLQGETLAEIRQTLETIRVSGSDCLIFLLRDNPDRCL